MFTEYHRKDSDRFFKSGDLAGQTTVPPLPVHLRGFGPSSTNGQERLPH